MFLVPAERSNRDLDVVTAVMLGLVSVVTALGAWQAAAWDARAAEFARDAGSARDVAVNQSVLVDYATRADTEASAIAFALAGDLEETDDVFERIIIETELLSTLGSTTPGFSDLWQAWREDGFDPADHPLDDPDYLVLREGFRDSYSVTSAVQSDLASTLSLRSGILGQAALIQALALFLFGIAGVNRIRAVRVAVLALGGTVFLSGVLLALSAAGAGG